MSKSVVMLSSILTAGIALGLSAVYIAGFPKSDGPAPETASREQPLTSAFAVADEDTANNNTETISFAENPAVAEAVGDVESGKLSDSSLDVAALQAQIAVEAAARRRMEVQLGGLKKSIETLQQQLAELAEQQRDNTQDRSDNSRQLDEDAFIAAGFTPADAAYLAQRVGQQEMEMLYLRDQAIREGWADTPRYEEAARELRNDRISLREELGTDGYDRFLYASGQPNRVLVDSVIDSSPGQTIGLQPGDVIMSYNGDRVYSQWQ